MPRPAKGLVNLILDCQIFKDLSAYNSERFLPQAIIFFTSSKNITPIPIASYPKKSHHPYIRETRKMLFSNSEHHNSIKLAPCQTLLIGVTDICKKRNLVL
jgi:hypothetical protein